MNEKGNPGNIRAETVPTVKRDARAFRRWFDEAKHGWPADLFTLGHHAADALDTLDQPNVPEIAVRLAAKDMKAFMEAYGEFRARPR